MEPDYVKLKSVKPVLACYIRESQILLRRAPVPDDEAIHEVRVFMKKSRSALKLVASQLDRESVTREMVALREVGRKICSVRESFVLRKTLKEFKKDFPGIFSRLAEVEKISFILKKPETYGEPSEDLKSEMEEINQLLKKAGYRIRFLSMNNIDPRMLLKELELTYLKVVDIYLKCRNNARPEDLHELRKTAKDFLYQLYFFRPLNPDVIKALEKRVDGITQYLGRYNDLTQLVMALGYDYAADRYLPAMDELVIRIREKQDRYLSKVWPATFKIFCPGQKLVNILGFKLLVI